MDKNEIYESLKKWVGEGFPKTTFEDPDMIMFARLFDQARTFDTDTVEAIKATVHSFVLAKKLDSVKPNQVQLSYDDLMAFIKKLQEILNRKE